MPDFIEHSSCASLLHALFSALRAYFKAVFRLALTPVPPRLAAGRARRPYVDGFKGEGRKALRALTGAVLRFTFRHPACRRRAGRVGGLRRLQGRESGKRLIVDTSWRAKKPCVRFTCPLYFSFVSGVLWIHPDAWKRGHERFTPQGTYRAIASTRIAGLAGVRLE
jgi:hypothetical protein